MASLKQLLSKSSPNELDNAGYTALHYAARNGHLDICETLLNAGASVNLTTRAGNATALHRASTMGHLQVVDLLLKHGADVSIKDSDGYNSIQRAAKAGQNTILEALLKFRPDLSYYLEDKTCS